MADPERILVSIPNWVGDAVMATAALRALRQRFDRARIVFLMRPYVAEVLAGTGFGDENIYWPLPRTTRKKNTGADGSAGYVDLVKRLRRERFDLAVLFTNSFRSAMIARLSGAKRRAGYDRDSRGWLLTDKLTPKREGGKYLTDPALDYYNRLAEAVGCESPGDRLELATSEADEAAICERLGEGLGKSSTPGPLIVLNPGANYGSAKCWPAESYAALSDTLVRTYNARVVASLGPKEREIADRLAAAVKEPIDIFVDPPLGLGPLKALVRRCQLLITNDTGPRHFAVAFDVPVVTVFGSSDPEWTITRFAKERIAMLNLDCQPCMERVCPEGHHNCMQQLEPDAVLEKVAELLGCATVVGQCAPE